MPNPFPSYAVKTIHTLDGEDVNRLIQKTMGRGIDPVSDGDVPGDDSSGVLTVNIRAVVTPLQRKDLEEFAKNGGGDAVTVLYAFLSDLCLRGDIPAGEYQIAYSWG